MSVRDTRKKIVRATRELHEEVGPAATTISGIAERAGVQRLTVYRHFPDDGALIGACSADWSEDHPLPAPAEWSGIEDAPLRLRTALAALYEYFRNGAPMLRRVLRDAAEVPELGEVMEPWWDYMGQTAAGLAAGWGTDAEGQRLLRAVVDHAVGFSTWRSLSQTGLEDEEIVDLTVDWVQAVAAANRAS